MANVADRGGKEGEDNCIEPVVYSSVPCDRYVKNNMSNSTQHHTIRT